MKHICIVGTGGFAREVCVILEVTGRKSEIAAFLEPDVIWEEKWKDKSLQGIPVLPMSVASPAHHKVLIGIADPNIRKQSVLQLPSEMEYLTLIHPAAHITEGLKLGDGSIVTAGCFVSCEVQIGVHAQLNWNTTIGHDAIIGDFFTTAPAVNVGGNCHIGDQVYMGTGVAIKQGIQICNEVKFGMGAVAVRDIRESGTYVGIPAIKIK